MNQMQMYFMMMKKRYIEPITGPVIRRWVANQDYFLDSLYSYSMESFEDARTKRDALTGFVDLMPVYCSYQDSGHIVFRSFFAINKPPYRAKDVTINILKKNPGSLFEDCYLFTSTGYGDIWFEDFGTIGQQVSERTASDADSLTIRFNQAGLDILNAHTSSLSLMIRNYRDVEGGPVPTAPHQTDNGLLPTTATVTYTF